MSFTIQFKRGTTAQNDAYTGPAGSVTIDVERNEIRIHDGSTAGGHVVSDQASIQQLQQQLDSLGITDVAGLESALASKIDLAEKGVANGVATLNSSGLIPASQLPSFVEEVLEFADFDALPAEGETGKIYITLDDNHVYRWSGSVYVEIVAAPGSTDSIAEGENNLYFTTARARNSINVSGDLSYDSETGVISYTAESVTKESIGLGLVQNYGIATSQQAIDADSNEAYMTPLRTRNFVESIGFAQDGNGDWFLDQGQLS